MTFKDMRIARRLWLTLTALAMMTVLIGMVGVYYNQVTSDLAHKISSESYVYDEIIMTFRIKVADAHLWFEEVIAGDTNEDIEDIWECLQETGALLDLLEEGGNHKSSRVVGVDEWPEAHKLVQSLQLKHRHFISVARARYRALAGATGVGSDVDQDFDKEYQLVQRQAQAVSLFLSHHFWRDSRKV